MFTAPEGMDLGDGVDKEGTIMFHAIANII